MAFHLAGSEMVYWSQFCGEWKRHKWLKPMTKWNKNLNIQYQVPFEEKPPKSKFLRQNRKHYSWDTWHHWGKIFWKDVGHIEQSRFIIQHQCIFCGKVHPPTWILPSVCHEPFCQCPTSRQKSLGYLFIFGGTNGNIEICVCFQIYMQESPSTNCSVTQEIGVYHRTTRKLRPK